MKENSIYKDDIIGKVIEIKKEKNSMELLIKSNKKVLVYLKKNISVNLGDKVEVKGKINSFKSNTIFNVFNYKNYMKSKNISYSLYSSDIKVLKKNKNFLYYFKTKLINRIEKYKSRSYLKLFILGDNNELDDNILNSYRINGISHLFSISGMHVGLFSALLLLILNRIKKTKMNSLIISLLLFLYAFFIGLTPSVFRAVTFFLFISLNKLFKLKLSNLKIFIFLTCFSLIINPYNIYNTGFLFSYIISFYLILFSVLIVNQKNYILKLFITSFISFIASIPILISSFYSINLMTVFNNLIFVPFVSLILFPLSLLVLLIQKLDSIYFILINTLESVSLFITKFKLEIVLMKANIYVYVFYYALITYTLYSLKKKRIFPVIIIVLTIIIHKCFPYFNKNLYVTFFDVNQGDSLLLHMQKFNILVDTGGNYNYNVSNNVITYLKSEGISKLDYLIITHGDYDHMGEAINLVNNFKVEKVIFNCGPYNDLEKELIKVLDKKKIKYYSCIKELNIDDNKLYFLQTKLYDNENDNSNVIYTELNGYKFMFMGDAGATTEKEMLDKYKISNIDVLKVGHHGSRTSSSKEFINEINPKYSIISVGKNNRYGHPNKEVLDILEESKIYRTDEDGSIMFKIKNNRLKIETCSP